MAPILKFTMRELANIINLRLDNKLTAEMVVHGERGMGKSTFCVKLVSLFKQYRPMKHQVYSRNDVIHLLKTQKRGFIFDDEGINSLYRRAFFDQNQQKLIKMLNMYRDNWNFYMCCIPNFMNLDKDFRSLVKFNVHIVQRGLAILHASRQGIYNEDPWDIKNNLKLEEKWNKRKQRDPKFKIPYHRLSTFVGYIIFNDITEKQREIYEKIKIDKRNILYNKEIAETPASNREDLSGFIIECLNNGFIHSTKQIDDLILSKGAKPDPTKKAINYILKNQGLSTISGILKEKQAQAKKLNDSANPLLPSDPTSIRSKSDDDF